MTKFLQRVALPAILAGAFGLAAAQPAAAEWHGHWRGDIHVFHERDWDHWRGGHWLHAHHGGRLGWWWVVGPYWYFYPEPVYPYPNPYLPPTVIVEQRQPAPQGPPPTQNWYYCDGPKGYYPYVTSCPTPWREVPATPPGPTQ